MPAPPPLMLSGGRQLAYERSFSAEADVKVKRSFWTRLLDAVAGPPELHELVRPYAIAVDSKGRIIVTDPGIPAVHIFDFPKQKYTFIQKAGKREFNSPQCVAVDGQDNIYITDSAAGTINIFDPSGKFRRVIGALKGGEGYFKHPTGIAVDSTVGRIFVSDTQRHKIFVMNMQGDVLQTIGQRGSDVGELNFPTDLVLHGQELVVVDALNFRIQAFDRSGKFLQAIGRRGATTGTMFRPKGIGFDSESNLYVVENLFEIVQVFNHDGHLLYYFGHSGAGPQEFQLPTGLFIDRNNRIYVVDSLNRRVQIFRYAAASAKNAGGT
jgi:DNA-binding beta-propeller fold protein YncE